MRTVANIVLLLLSSCVVVHIEPVRTVRVAQGSATGQGSAAPEPLPVNPCATITIGTTGSIGWSCMPGAVPLYEFLGGEDPMPLGTVTGSGTGTLIWSPSVGAP